MAKKYKKKRTARRDISVAQFSRFFQKGRRDIKIQKGTK